MINMLGKVGFSGTFFMEGINKTKGQFDEKTVRKLEKCPYERVASGIGAVFVHNDRTPTIDSDIEAAAHFIKNGLPFEYSAETENEKFPIHWRNYTIKIDKPKKTSKK